jgi:hypothetical protein
MARAQVRGYLLLVVILQDYPVILRVSFLFILPDKNSNNNNRSHTKEDRADRLKDTRTPPHFLKLYPKRILVLLLSLRIRKRSAKYDQVLSPLLILSSKLRSRLDPNHRQRRIVKVPRPRPDRLSPLPQSRSQDQPLLRLYIPLFSRSDRHHQISNNKHLSPINQRPHRPFDHLRPLRYHPYRDQYKLHKTRPAQARICWRSGLSSVSSSLSFINKTDNSCRYHNARLDSTHTSHSNFIQLRDYPLHRNLRTPLVRSCKGTNDFTNQLPMVMGTILVQDFQV